MIDLGAYKDKFGDSGQRILEHALNESRRRDQNYVSIEHILHGLATQEADLFNQTMRAEVRRNLFMASGGGSVPVVSPR